MVEENAGKHTEQIIREYFESRAGWIVEKLDTGKQKAADYRICGHGNCFLCEVKNIESVHSNFPYQPLDYYLKERGWAQEFIRSAKEENPQSHIVMPPEQWEFTFGDMNEFINKHHMMVRNTEMHFNRFANEMAEFLTKDSKVKDLPYSIRLDSDDLYIPWRQKRLDFLHWIENEIELISKGIINWYWQDNGLPYIRSFTNFKTMKVYDEEGKIKSRYQITVEGPLKDGPLLVYTHSYGVLNEKAIIQEIEKAISQIDSSSQRELDQEIPRVVALGFSSGLGFDDGQLYKLIDEQLKTHTDLSAIVVIQKVPETFYLHKEDEDILDWLSSTLKIPFIPGFYVVHNSWLRKNIKPLHIDAFNFGKSFQISPLKT
jgi:hypothetical protein